MRFLAALLVAMGLASTACAQPAFQWPNGARAAVVLTYDDALVSHLDIAAPHLDQAGLKGTFFITGTFAQSLLPRWRALASNGHELGNHTIFHPCARGSFDMPVRYNSESYDVPTMLAEISAQNTFLSAIDGLASHTLATPCGQTRAGGVDYMDALRQSNMLRFVRNASGEPSDPRTVDPFDVPAHFFPDTATGADMIAYVESAVRNRRLVVIGFHGVGGDYLVNTAQSHQDLVSYLAAHQRDIWIAPFGEVMDYVVTHR